MIEILGNNLEQAFKYFGINGKQTYKTKCKKFQYQKEYEVWELSDDDFDKLCNLKDDDWEDEWGWWRHTSGSNIKDSPTRQVIINGEDIKVYYDEYRLKEYINDYIDDYIDECKNKDIARNNLIKHYFDYTFIYSLFTDYCCTQWGVSTEKNVCAIAVETARLNNIKLSELFEKYQG